LISAVDRSRYPRKLPIREVRGAESGAKRGGKLANGGCPMSATGSGLGVRLVAGDDNSFRFAETRATACMRGSQIKTPSRLRFTFSHEIGFGRLRLCNCFRWRGLPNSPDYGGTPTDAVNQPHTPRRGFVRQGLPINSKIAASGIRPRRFVPIRSSRRGSAIEASMTMRRGDLAASCGSSTRRGPAALLLLAASKAV
jgi:hypothetical protein